MLGVEEDVFMCAVQLEDTENLPITQRIFKIIYEHETQHKNVWFAKSCLKILPSCPFSRGKVQSIIFIPFALIRSFKLINIDIIQ